MKALLMAHEIINLTTTFAPTFNNITYSDLVNVSNETYSVSNGTYNVSNETYSVSNETYNVSNLADVSNGTYNVSDLVDARNVTNEDELNITGVGIIVQENVPFYFDFQEEPWVVPLVSFSLFNIAIIFIFEVYVLYKYFNGRRHLFLGQILLLGLFLCSVLGLFYIPKPHWFLCAFTRAGLGVAYALVFGTLLVKCVFLLKIHDGVYFNASFQAFLLFFIVAVEIAIVVQWLAYKPPDITSVEVSGEMRTACEQSPLQRIEYLTYVMLLLFLVIVSSIRARSLRENNREAMYIGISIAISLIFWVAWIAIAIIFDRRYDAPAEAFGLLSTALIVFLLIFIPKAAHLASKRSKGNGSSNHSVIHTPSFLHLQPHAILPSSTQGTLVKQQSHLNADYCRGGYTARMWHDYPSFHQMEQRAISISDMNSLKKSNPSSGYDPSHLY